MKKEKSVLIIGGDKRQRKLKKYLSDDGYTVTHIEKEEECLPSLFKENKIIFLPIPVSKDRVYIYSDNKESRLRVTDVTEQIDNTSVVFGGNFDASVKKYFEEEGIEYHDCLKSELLELQNGYLTSQGALRLLLENTEEFLTSKNVLITGFGKIGMPLAALLDKIGMNVSVGARNELQLKNAVMAGYTPVELKSLSTLSKCDFIFNTVPCRIFDESLIETADKKAVYFELASSPFGADKENILKYGLSYVDGSSLPGKFLSDSSAELLKEYMEKFL